MKNYSKNGAKSLSKLIMGRWEIKFRSLPKSTKQNILPRVYSSVFRINHFPSKTKQEQK